VGKDKVGHVTCSELFPCDSYRNTNKHNVCLELLKNGNHESFRELVALIDKQKEDRERAGKDSGHYYDPLLENEDAKLHQLKVYLSAAEDGKRNGQCIANTRYL
jgi:hypothetical protein